MDEKTTNSFRLAQIRAQALRSVGSKKDDDIVDSILKLDALPDSVKKTIKDAKIMGKSGKAIDDLLKLNLQQSPTGLGSTGDEASYDTANKGGIGGALNKAGRFLGIEKAGRFVGSKLATLSPEFKAAREAGVDPEELNRLSRGNVTNRELVGSVANVGLNLALPFAGKALSAGSTASKLGKAAIVGGAFGGSGALEQNKKGSDIVEGIALGAGLGVGGEALLRSFPKIVQGFQSYRQELAGISPQTKGILSELPDASKFEKYVQSAKQRSTDIRKNSPIGLAAQELEDAGSILKKKIATAGKQVRDVKKAVGKEKLGDISDVSAKFKEGVADRFGINLSSKKGAISVKPVAGSARNISAGDKKRLVQAYKDIVKLEKSGNIQKAQDVIANLADLGRVSFDKNSSQFGVKKDPIESFFKGISADLNKKIRGVSKDLAKANDRYTELKKLEKFIGSTAGKDLGRGELLLRRVFSGDKSREALNVLEQIKKITGKDLTQDAVLAKLAIEQFGDKSQQTLLTQIIQGAGETGANAIGSRDFGAIRLLGKLGKGGAKAVLGGTERVGRGLVGKTSKAPRVSPEARRQLGQGVRQVGANIVGRTLGGL